MKAINLLFAIKMEQTSLVARATYLKVGLSLQASGMKEPWVGLKPERAGPATR